MASSSSASSSSFSFPSSPPPHTPHQMNGGFMHQHLQTPSGPPAVESPAASSVLASPSQPHHQQQQQQDFSPHHPSLHQHHTSSLPPHFFPRASNGVHGLPGFPYAHPQPQYQHPHPQHHHHHHHHVSSLGGYDATLAYVDEEAPMDDEYEVDDDDDEEDDAAYYAPRVPDPKIYQEKRTPFITILRHKLRPTRACRMRFHAFLWYGYEFLLFTAICFVIFGGSIRRFWFNRPQYEAAFNDIYFAFFIVLLAEFLFLLKFHPLYRKELHLIFLDLLAIGTILPKVNWIWNPLLNALFPLSGSIHSDMPTYYPHTSETNLLYDASSAAYLNYHSPFSQAGSSSNNEFHIHTLTTFSLTMLFRTAFHVRILRFIKSRFLLVCLSWIQIKRKEVHARQRKKAWIARAKEKLAREKLRKKLTKEKEQQQQASSAATLTKDQTSLQSLDQARILQAPNVKSTSQPTSSPEPESELEQKQRSVTPPPTIASIEVQPAQATTPRDELSGTPTTPGTDDITPTKDDGTTSPLQPVSTAAAIAALNQQAERNARGSLSVGISQIVDDPDDIIVRISAMKPPSSDETSIVATSSSRAAGPPLLLGSPSPPADHAHIPDFELPAGIAAIEERAATSVSRLHGMAAPRPLGRGSLFRKSVSPSPPHTDESQPSSSISSSPSHQRRRTGSRFKHIVSASSHGSVGGGTTATTAVAAASAGEEKGGTDSALMSQANSRRSSIGKSHHTHHDGHGIATSYPHHRKHSISQSPSSSRSVSSSPSDAPHISRRSSLLVGIPVRPNDDGPPPLPADGNDEHITNYALSHLSSMHTTEVAVVAPFSPPSTLRSVDDAQLYDDTPSRMQPQPPYSNGNIQPFHLDDRAYDHRHHPHHPYNSHAHTNSHGGVVDYSDDSDSESEYDDSEWESEYARSHVEQPSHINNLSKRDNNRSKLMNSLGADDSNSGIGSFTSHQLSDFTTAVLIFLILIIVYLYHLLHDLPIDPVAKVGLNRSAFLWNQLESQIQHMNDLLTNSTAAIAQYGDSQSVSQVYSSFLTTLHTFDLRTSFFLASLPLVHFSLQHSTGFHMSTFDKLNWQAIYPNTNTSSTDTTLNLVYQPYDTTIDQSHLSTSPFFLSLLAGVHSTSQYSNVTELASVMTLDRARQQILPGYYNYLDTTTLKSRLMEEEISRWKSDMWTQNYNAPTGNGSDLFQPVPIGLCYMAQTSYAYWITASHFSYLIFFWLVTSLLMLRYDLYIQRILKPIERMMAFIERMMADPLGEITLGDPLASGSSDDEESEVEFTIETTGEFDSKMNWSRDTNTNEMEMTERQVLMHKEKEKMKEAAVAAVASVAAAAAAVTNGNPKRSPSASKKFMKGDSVTPPATLDPKKKSPLGSPSQSGMRRHESFDANTGVGSLSNNLVMGGTGNLVIPLRRRRPSNSRSRASNGAHSVSPSPPLGPINGNQRSPSPPPSDPGKKRISPRPSIIELQEIVLQEKEKEKEKEAKSKDEDMKQPAATGTTAAGATNDSSTALVVPSHASNKSISVNKGNVAISSSTVATVVASKTRRFSNETSTVEKSLLKLALLLQVGFGVAGSSIISNNLIAGDLLNPIQKGRKIFAIFGFCDLKPIVQSYFDSGDSQASPSPSPPPMLHPDEERDGQSSASQSFIEQIMIFINQLQAIVHGETHKYGGFINSSIGSNTLMAWKFDVEGFAKIEQQYPASSFINYQQQPPNMNMQHHQQQQHEFSQSTSLNGVVTVGGASMTSLGPVSGVSGGGGGGGGLSLIRTVSGGGGSTSSLQSSIGSRNSLANPRQSLSVLTRDAQSHLPFSSTQSQLTPSSGKSGGKHRRSSSNTNNAPLAFASLTTPTNIQLTPNRPRRRSSTGGSTGILMNGSSNGGIGGGGGGGSNGNLPSSFTMSMSAIPPSVAMRSLSIGAERRNSHSSSNGALSGHVSPGPYLQQLRQSSGTPNGMRGSVTPNRLKQQQQQQQQLQNQQIQSNYVMSLASPPSNPAALTSSMAAQMQTQAYRAHGGGNGKVKRNPSSQPTATVISHSIPLNLFAVSGAAATMQQQLPQNGTTQIIHPSELDGHTALTVDGGDGTSNLVILDTEFDRIQSTVADSAVRDAQMAAAAAAARLARQQLIESGGSTVSTSLTLRSDRRRHPIMTLTGVPQNEEVGRNNVMPPPSMSPTERLKLPIVNYPMIEPNTNNTFSDTNVIVSLPSQQTTVPTQSPISVPVIDPLPSNNIAPIVTPIAAPSASIDSLQADVVAIGITPPQQSRTRRIYPRRASLPAISNHRALSDLQGDGSDDVATLNMGAVLQNDAYNMSLSSSATTSNSTSAVHQTNREVMALTSNASLPIDRLDQASFVHSATTADATHNVVSQSSHRTGSRNFSSRSGVDTPVTPPFAGSIAHAHLQHRSRSRQQRPRTNSIPDILLIGPRDQRKSNAQEQLPLKSDVTSPINNSNNNTTGLIVARVISPPVLTNELKGVISPPPSLTATKPRHQHSRSMNHAMIAAIIEPPPSTTTAMMTTTQPVVSVVNDFSMMPTQQPNSKMLLVDPSLTNLEPMTPPPYIPSRSGSIEDAVSISPEPFRPPIPLRQRNRGVLMPSPPKPEPVPQQQQQVQPSPEPQPLQQQQTKTAPLLAPSPRQSLRGTTLSIEVPKLDDRLALHDGVWEHAPKINSRANHSRTMLAAAAAAAAAKKQKQQRDGATADDENSSSSNNDSSSSDESTPRSGPMTPIAIHHDRNGIRQILQVRTPPPNALETLMAQMSPITPPPYQSGTPQQGSASQTPSFTATSSPAPFPAYHLRSRREPVRFDTSEAQLDQVANQTAQKHALMKLQQQQAAQACGLGPDEFDYNFANPITFGPPGPTAKLPGTPEFDPLFGGRTFGFSGVNGKPPTFSMMSPPQQQRVLQPQSTQQLQPQVPQFAPVITQGARSNLPQQQYPQLQNPYQHQQQPYQYQPNPLPQLMPPMPHPVLSGSQQGQFTRPFLPFSSPFPQSEHSGMFQASDDFSPDNANIDSLLEDPNSPHNDITRAFVRMSLHPYGQMELTRTATQALLAFTKTLVKIATDESLHRWRKHALLKPHLTGIGGIRKEGHVMTEKELQQQPNHTTSVLTNRGAGMGLHIGWAIEGAIGSKHKIDATYLSPNVNLASRLAAATKQYYVALLFSHNFFRLLPQILRDRCRLVDRVLLKGCAKAMSMYTFDIFLEPPPPQPINHGMPAPQPQHLSMLVPTMPNMMPPPSASAIPSASFPGVASSSSLLMMPHVSSSSSLSSVSMLSPSMNLDPYHPSTGSFVNTVATSAAPTSGVITAIFNHAAPSSALPPQQLLPQQQQQQQQQQQHQQVNIYPPHDTAYQHHAQPHQQGVASWPSHVNQGTSLTRAPSIGGMTQHQFATGVDPNTQLMTPPRVQPPAPVVPWSLSDSATIPPLTIPVKNVVAVASPNPSPAMSTAVHASLDQDMVKLNQTRRSSLTGHSRDFDKTQQQSAHRRKASVSQAVQQQQQVELALLATQQQHQQQYQQLQMQQHLQVISQQQQQHQQIQHQHDLQAVSNMANPSVPLAQLSPSSIPAPTFLAPSTSATMTGVPSSSHLLYPSYSVPNLMQSSTGIGVTPMNASGGAFTFAPSTLAPSTIPQPMSMTVPPVQQQQQQQHQYQHPPLPPPPPMMMPPTFIPPPLQQQGSFLPPVGSSAFSPAMPSALPSASSTSSISSLTNDPILQKLLFVLFSLQQHVPHPLFILTHNHATKAYIQGDWSSARQLYTQVLEWHPNDGPARALLEYMARFNFIAPPIWFGYRRLEKK